MSLRTADECGRRNTGRRGCGSPWEGQGVWAPAAFRLGVDLGGILSYVGEKKGAAVPTTPRWFSACLATWPIRCGGPAASSALHLPRLR